MMQLQALLKKAKQGQEKDKKNIKDTRSLSGDFQEQ